MSIISLRATISKTKPEIHLSNDGIWQITIRQIFVKKKITKERTKSDSNNKIELIDSQKMYRDYFLKNKNIGKFLVQEVVFGRDKGKYRIYFQAPGRRSLALAKQARSDRDAGYRVFSSLDTAVRFLGKCGVLQSGSGRLEISLQKRKVWLVMNWHKKSTEVTDGSYFSSSQTFAPTD